MGGRKIREITPAGVVTTLAGSGAEGSADGTGTAASFSEPIGMAIDTTGNLYVLDYGNSNIRKITPAGVVTTIVGSGTPCTADGIVRPASFCLPEGIAIDASGTFYVAEPRNPRIGKITSMP
jgi:sugar lactone lactonase YvrE